MAKLAVNGGVPLRQKPWPKWPGVGDEDIQAVTEVLETGKVGRLTVFGREEPSRVDAFREAWLRQYPGKDYAIPCSSCCTALELSLRNAGIGPGDEVIVPASTICTYLAPLQVGAVPVFADVSPENYCIDPDSIEAAITPKTRAVMPVHIGGYCCQIDRIVAIAEQHDLVVIEDCAQAHGSKYRGRNVGTWGHFGCFSFDVWKLMTAGEGGLVVCDDEDLGDRVFGLYGQVGEQVDRMLSGKKRKNYGWNYRMTEFQAAMLLVQLTRVEGDKARRTANADYLRRRLAEVEGIGDIASTPGQNYYSYMFRYDSSSFQGVPKQKFEQALKAEGIDLFCTPGNQAPGYRSPGFHYPGMDFSDVHCPVAERAFEEEAVGLHATYVLLAEKEDMDDVVQAILKIRGHLNELG